MIRSISNAVVYVNGIANIGNCTSVELPEIEHRLVENEGLGLQGTIETYGGTEPMEATFEWNSFDAESFKAIANPTQTVQIQVRASQKESTLLGDTEVPVVAFLTGIFKTVPIGSFTKNESVELSSEMAVSYVRLMIGGEEIIEINAFTNVYRVGGVDVLASLRANLGA